MRNVKTMDLEDQVMHWIDRGRKLVTVFLFRKAVWIVMPLVKP